MPALESVHFHEHKSVCWPTLGPDGPETIQTHTYIRVIHTMKHTVTDVIS